MTPSHQNQQEYIWVIVQNPLIHHTFEDGKYTTYEVELKTNSLSFTDKTSLVRRSYSEFVWLRKALAKTTARSPPQLPLEKFFRRFDEDYLKNNEKVLTSFLQNVVKNTFFVASSPLHLFLQTELSMKEMSSLVEEQCRRGSMNSIARAISKCGSFSRGKYSSSSSEKSVKSDLKNSNSSLDSTSTENDVFFLKTDNGYSDISHETLPNGIKSSEQNRNIWSKKTILYKRNQFLVEDIIENDEEHNDWVIVNSIPRFHTRSLPDLNESETSSNVLSRSFTEVWWNIGKLRKFSKQMRKTSSTSQVTFSIGEQKILKNTDPTHSQLDNETNKISDLHNQPCSSKQNSSVYN